MIINLADRFPTSTPMPNHVYICHKDNSNDITYMVHYGKIGNVTTVYWCEECGFSEEDTMMWVLKYGKYLPTHIDQL